MTLKELPEKIKHPRQSISRIKIGILGIIVLLAVAFALAAQNRPPSATASDIAVVLGERTDALGDLLPDGGISDSSPEGKMSIPRNTADMVALGRTMVASVAGSVLGAVDQKAESIASSSAAGLSDFIYRNTIERVIDSLIRTLPEDRQKQYGK
jgi:hypothetical protein